MKINNLKPVFTGFFFLFFSILNSKSILTDSISTKNNFFNYEFFFTKSVKLFSGELIGKINGKIVLTKDSTKLYIIDKKNSFVIGYDQKGVFEEKQGKKSYQKDKSILKDLEIMTTLNPVEKLKNYRSNSEKNFLEIFPENGKVDVVKIFFDKNFLYDSIFFIKGKDTIMSTFYRYDDNMFPIEITTFDRLKMVVENIKNYRIKSIDFFE
uniref:Outer membrane lipoprotein carrier protein LolA n=1 Tax=candidate division WOR-3 bacterium TaxID=2052148 RepID=A0A7C3J5X7_UNCW3